MSAKPTPEKLASMGLEYDPSTGLIVKIGTNTHPAVKKAEERAVNKPKPLSEIQGYDDADFYIDHVVPMKEEQAIDQINGYVKHLDEKPENFVKSGADLSGVFENAGAVISIERPINGDDWAERNQKAVEELTGVKSIFDGPQLRKRMAELQESNPNALINNTPIGEKASSFVNNTGFDIEPNTDMQMAMKMFENAQGMVDKQRKKDKPKSKQIVSVPTDRDIEALSKQIRDIPWSMVDSDSTAKQRCFVGIDNGVSGSVGMIFNDGTYSFRKTPVKNEQDYTKAAKKINRIDGVKLREMLSVCGPGSMVMIERPMVNPQMFNSTMSAIRAFEATITILETLQLPYEVVDSKGFQKMFLPSGVFGDQLKPASLNAGVRLFPLTAAIKHPDRDGMLIAAYCKQKHK